MCEPGMECRNHPLKNLVEKMEIKGDKNRGTG